MDHSALSTVIKSQFETGRGNPANREQQMEAKQKSALK
jgi:hypothetical protein